MTSTVETRGRVRVEQGAKRVRAFVGGHLVADTIRPAYVWEKPYYPTYYLPLDDVRATLVLIGRTHASPSRGEGQIYTIRVGDRQVDDAALRYPDSPIEALRELVRLEWAAMDAWFEEDEEVYTHPRDPYTRVDILASSRRVRVEVDGVVVAESTHPYLLFETGLPTRYYLPKTDVRMDLLEHTDTVTHCPYKGQAEYWSVRSPGGLRTDLAWSYRTPLPESAKIAGRIAFYSDRVVLYVDGVRDGT